MHIHNAAHLTLLILLITGTLAAAQEPLEFREPLQDHYHTGDYLTVIRQTSGAIAQGDTSFNTLNLKALSEIRLGRTDSAILTLQRMQEIFPENETVRRLLAGQLFEAGAFHRAEDYYQTFARADSGDLEAWLRLARIASHRQQYDRTIGLLHHVLSVDPANFSSLVLLGEILTRRNDTAAIGIYERAYTLYPANQQVAYSLGNWYIQAGSPADAVPLCEQVLETDSTNIRFLKLLGFASYRMDQPSRAAGFFRRAIEQGDSTAFTFKFAGIAHHLMASFPQAINLLTVAAQLDSTDAEVHFFLGASLAGTTKKQEAMLHLDKSLELIQPDPAVIARIYSEQGNIMRLEMEYEKAYALYRNAWEADTTNPMALYYMASILDNSLHRSGEALADYRLFLEKLDRMSGKRYNQNSQLPTIREIVEDRIELLNEELFFLDQH